MRRSSRIFVDGWLNKGKLSSLEEFLHFYHDLEQYFVDVFWAQDKCDASLAPLPVIHKGRNKFETTTRMSQAAAKQAKQLVRSTRSLGGKRPKLHNPVAELCYHFVNIESFDGSFDLVAKLGGAGVPKVVVPCKSTEHLNKKLQRGWKIGKSIRLGMKNGRLYIDFILEKKRPEKRTEGEIRGLDSNYKNGLVMSDGTCTGKAVYEKISTFSKRRKHTHEQIRSMMGQTVRQLDLTGVKVLVIEDLKNVRKGTKGKFPKNLNRRLSHWTYSYTADLLSRLCEEEGILLQKKNPAYTSQFCRFCGKWDKRNRRGDRFKCIHCGHVEHADTNAACNLELLGLAGAYGLRLLKKSDCRTI